MKKVYTDGSTRNHMITWFIEGEKQFHYDNLERYLIGKRKKKIDSGEAEYSAIICALSSVQGDVEINSDAEGEINVLKNPEAHGKKNLDYVERIKRLEEGRKVKYAYCSKCENPASLKQDFGLSLHEIYRVLSDPTAKQKLINEKIRLAEIVKRETKKAHNKPKP